MKTIALLQRRHRGRSALRVSLFAFLAVLICTMGALMLLLLAVTREARVQAVHETAARAAKRQAEAAAMQQTFQLRRGEWKKSQQAAQTELLQARQDLGRLEAHARQLRQRLAQLKAAGADVDHAAAESTRHRNELLDELRRAQARIAEAKGNLDWAEQLAKRRPPSYAIIPYEGPNQTRRRPIYIECRADAVVLQPEGVRFGKSDFASPVGPGNPLAAALRAIRENMFDRGGFDPQRDGEPYPLLLVRPGGIAAYYIARDAMRWWTADFGYELIDDDWKVTFPPPDPQTARLLQQAVAKARTELAQSAAATSGRADRHNSSYRLNPNGGIVRENGPDEEDEDNSLALSDPPGGGERGSGNGGFGPSGIGFGNGNGNSPGGIGFGNGNGGGPGGVGFGNGNGNGPGSVGFGNGNGSSPGGVGFGNGNGNGPGGVGFGNGNGDGPGSVGFGNGNGNGSGGTGPGNTGNSLGNGGNGGPGGGSPGNGSGNSASQGQGQGGPGGTAGGPGGGQNNGVPQQPGTTSDTAQQSASGPRMAIPDGFIPGQPTAETDRSPSGRSSDAAVAVAPRPGEWQPHDLYPQQPDKNDKSLAKSRGKDWALRDANRKSTPFTRSIAIECYADRLALVPQDGYGVRKEIPLGPRTDEAMDKFIRAIWERMDSWGMAGSGMYWRPLLEVYVVAGGERRFADVTALLRNSGFTIERKM